MTQSEPYRSKITWWHLPIYVGSLLLLVGNTLPWPCPPGFGVRDCTALVTYRLSDSTYGILLAVGILLLPVLVYWFKPPWNTVYWLSFWLFIYLLLVHKLYPVDSGGAFPRFYLPLVSMNKDLGGPTSLVMPLSLFTFWLVIRPRQLQKGWWVAEAATLLTLLVTVSYFLIVIAQRVHNTRLSPTPFFDHQIFGSGPWAILVGSVLLLGVIIVRKLEQHKWSVSPEAGGGPPAVARPVKAAQVGTWAAVAFVTAAFFPLLLYLVGELASSAAQAGTGELQLFSALYQGAAYLCPIALLVLMVCIQITVPAEKKIWGRLGLIFAILYAMLFVASNLFFPLILRQQPELYHRLTSFIPLLTRMGGLSTISAPLLSLTGLFTLPLLTKRGIELAAAWCFTASGVLSVVGIIGMLLSTSRIPGAPLLIIQGANSLSFSVAIAMLAVGLKRRCA